MNTNMRNFFKLQRCIIALLGVSFLCGMLLGIGLVTNSSFAGGIFGLLKAEKKNLIEEIAASSTKIQPTKSANALDNVNEIEDKMILDKDNTNLDRLPRPNYNIHAFYYPWYGNPEFDDRYYHWNHPFLPHWNKREAEKWPKGSHEPPNDVGSNFYPELGPYSSRDPGAIENHMQQMRAAGIGVLAVSWYPPGLADDNGKPSDDLMPALLDAANKYSLKMCFHIEPYKKRNHKTIRENIQYIMDNYGNHPALYKHTWRGQQLPLYYIYDSYLVGRDNWGSVFRPDGALSVRGTPLDGIFIGLIVEDKHKLDIVAGGFDGFYPYFASDGFSYGASTRNWATLAKYAQTNDLLFIPSVGPGYIDERVRPWNRANTKERENGGYYEQSFKAALSVKPPIISITSFNEWGEGTQIERAVPKKYEGFQYQDYKPMEPDYYLVLTRKWSFKYRKHKV